MIVVIVAAFLLKLPLANLLFYVFGLSFILLVIKGWLKQLLAFGIVIIAGYFFLTNNSALQTMFGFRSSLAILAAGGIGARSGLR